MKIMDTPEEKNIESTPHTAEEVQPSVTRSKKRQNFWIEFFKLTLISLIIVIPLRLYVAQPFIVDGASMDPTFRNGQYLIVDELTYHFKSPERGSVLIFKYPRDEKKYFIKRVIGLPGETVSINEGVVTIFNDKHPGGLTLDEPYIMFPKNDTLEQVLGQGEYFVLGDNRRGSADSRVWGAVPEGNIVGRPMLRFYPPGVLPGDYTVESLE
jgi:signal peptidase I